VKAPLAPEDRKLSALDRTPARDAASAASRLKHAAAELGMLAGIARAELPGDEPARLRAWLERGDQAGMTYMERKPRDRADASSLLAGARSVLAALLPYPPERDPKAEAAIAAYARGEDYHRVLARKLDALALLATEIMPRSMSA